jgi:3-oxoacyl-[acyl-carrier protein] reductase
VKGPLDGKVAIVTGGSRGIGAEVGARLAEDGAAVVVSGRDGDRLQHTVREWETQGRAVLGVVADAASREDCERLVSTAKQHFGRIDVLVNNAGMTHDQLLVRMTDEDWDRVMEVNLRSAFLMTRAVSKALVRQKSGGRVINITSTAGAMGNAGQVNYSAAKAGPHRVHQGGGPRARALVDPRERRRPRAHRNRHDQRSVGDRPRGAARPGATQTQRNGP